MPHICRILISKKCELYVGQIKTRVFILFKKINRKITKYIVSFSCKIISFRTKNALSPTLSLIVYINI